MVHIEDIVSPTGEVQRHFFPEDSDTAFNERIKGYIDDGYSQAASVTPESSRDRAVRNWATYRAFDSLHTMIISRPASVSISDTGSRVYTGEQIRSFEAKAERHRMAAMVVIDSFAAESTIQRPGGTGSVNVNFHF